jgi:hypothetical protein
MSAADRCPERSFAGVWAVPGGWLTPSLWQEPGVLMAEQSWRWRVSPDSSHATGAASRHVQQLDRPCSEVKIQTDPVLAARTVLPARRADSLHCMFVHSR